MPNQIYKPPTARRVEIPIPLELEKGIWLISLYVEYGTNYTNYHWINVDLQANSTPTFGINHVGGGYNHTTITGFYANQSEELASLKLILLDHNYIINQQGLYNIICIRLGDILEEDGS